MREWIKENKELIIIISILELSIILLLNQAINYNGELMKENEELNKIIKAQNGRTYESYQEFLYNKNMEIKNETEIKTQ